MAIVGFRIKGLKRWTLALKSGPFKEELRRQIKRATQLNALYAVKKVRQVIISSDSLDPNAALTIAIKGSTKPGVDHGDLFQAIAHRMVSDHEAFVGIARTSSAFNVAAILHEGATIKVTPAMRGMFFFLYKATEAVEGRGEMPKLTGRAAELWERSKSWKPLSPSTTAIVIPGRPFIEIAFRDPELRRMAEKNWADAVQTTFRNRSR